MTLPAFVSSAVESWAAFYDAHHAVSVTVRFLHLAGIVLGGGTALTADLRVLRAAGSTARGATLEVLRASHRAVVPALGLVVATGALMTATDTDTFFASRHYWVKLGLVALLLANGLGLLAAEKAATRGVADRGWRRLR